MFRCFASFACIIQFGGLTSQLQLFLLSTQCKLFPEVFFGFWIEQLAKRQLLYIANIFFFSSLQIHSHANILSLYSQKNE